MKFYDLSFIQLLYFARIYKVFCHMTRIVTLPGKRSCTELVKTIIRWNSNEVVIVNGCPEIYYLTDSTSHIFNFCYTNFKLTLKIFSRSKKIIFLVRKLYPEQILKWIFRIQYHWLVKMNKIFLRWILPVAYLTIFLKKMLTVF